MRKKFNLSKADGPRTVTLVLDVATNKDTADETQRGGIGASNSTPPSSLSSGSMVVSSVSSAIVKAENKFRRVQGRRDIEKLVQALEAIERKQEAEAKHVA
jgi:hypothetical protein